MKITLGPGGHRPQPHSTQHTAHRGGHAQNKSMRRHCLAVSLGQEQNWIAGGATTSGRKTQQDGERSPTPPRTRALQNAAIQIAYADMHVWQNTTADVHRAPLLDRKPVRITTASSSALKRLVCTYQSKSNAASSMHAQQQRWI